MREWRNNERKDERRGRLVDGERRSGGDEQLQESIGEADRALLLRLLFLRSLRSLRLLLCFTGNDFNMLRVDAALRAFELCILEVQRPDAVAETVVRQRTGHLHFGASLLLI